jgi:hypothetical protein
MVGCLRLHGWRLISPNSCLRWPGKRLNRLEGASQVRGAARSYDRIHPLPLPLDRGLRREHLRQELDAIRRTEAQPGLELMLATVRRAVTDLPTLLAAGQVERVRSALCRLVTRIEVDEEQRPGRKRPGARLLLQGNLQAALQLASEEVTSDGSPGGVLPVRNGSLPQAEQVTRLPKRMRKGRNAPVTIGTGYRE